MRGHRPETNASLDGRRQLISNTSKTTNAPLQQHGDGTTAQRNSDIPTIYFRNYEKEDYYNTHDFMYRLFFNSITLIRKMKYLRETRRHIASVEQLMRVSEMIERGIDRITDKNDLLVAEELVLLNFFPIIATSIGANYDAPNDDDVDDDDDDNRTNNDDDGTEVANKKNRSATTLLAQLENESLQETLNQKESFNSTKKTAAKYHNLLNMNDVDDMMQYFEEMVTHEVSTFKFRYLFLFALKREPNLRRLVFPISNAERLSHFMKILDKIFDSETASNNIIMNINQSNVFNMIIITVQECANMYMQMPVYN